MGSSIFLAQVMGLYFIIKGITIYIRRKQWVGIYQQFVDSHALAFVAGLVMVILGLLLVLVHTVIAFDWRILVTITAWTILWKGIFTLMLPVQLVQYLKFISKSPMVYLVALSEIVVGIILTYVGFFS